MEETIVLEEKLENMREKLNKYIIKYINNPSEEEYRNLIGISRRVDDVIVNYIRNSNK
ncbi:hypothetical protein [Clostridium beijerinckii]|uniref:hypothetical protein n=1 Tax=Clostridium beijerinckii TaxID=1520 RepID=UPI000AE18E40|nr:hypothetical protein [Clostridium beijerinckii]